MTIYYIYFYFRLKGVDKIITQTGNLFVSLNSGGNFKSFTVSGFSAARYLTKLAASESKGSVVALKRNLQREANKIKRSGEDDAKIKKALQKIKYVMKKADEKLVNLRHEDKIKERIKRAEYAERKNDERRCKKSYYVKKYFRKSNEHGNIARTALYEKDQIKESDFEMSSDGNNFNSSSGQNICMTGNSLCEPQTSSLNVTI